MGEETYRDRNKIERFFGRMKQYRRSVKPYDKTKFFFLNIFECCIIFLFFHVKNIIFNYSRAVGVGAVGILVLAIK